MCRRASFMGCNQCSSTEPRCSEGPCTRRWMLWGQHSRILKYLVYEFVFCKWSPTGSWSIHQGLGAYLLASHAGSQWPALSVPCTPPGLPLPTAGADTLLPSARGCNRTALAESWWLWPKPRMFILHRAPQITLSALIVSLKLKTLY